MRKGQILIAGTLLLFPAGCFPTPTPVPTQAVLPSETLSETAAATFVVVTSTPEPVEPTLPAATEPPVNVEEKITLTQITDWAAQKRLSPGKLYVIPEWVPKCLVRREH